MPSYASEYGSNPQNGLTLKLLLCFSEDEAIAAHEVAEGNLPEATDVHGRFQASEVAVRI